MEEPSNLIISSSSFSSSIFNWRSTSTSIATSIAIATSISIAESINSNRCISSPTTSHRLVQFRSASDFSVGVRELARKTRSTFRLEKVPMDQQQWDLITPCNGRYAIFRGIPRNALSDDVERLLSGCNYEASSVEIFTRGMQPAVVRMAKVRFPLQIEAMNAVIRKNGSFCLNERIVAQLIQ